MSWAPTDLIDYIKPVRQLVIFLAGAVVWEKLKPAGVSLRFALLLAVVTAVAASIVLMMIEIGIGRWIT